MPDLQNHSVVLTANKVQVGPSALSTILEYQISGKVADSKTGAQLATYSFLWPNILTSLTAAQYDALMQMIFRFLITCETGY